MSTYLRLFRGNARVTRRKNIVSVFTSTSLNGSLELHRTFIYWWNGRWFHQSSQKFIHCSKCLRVDSTGFAWFGVKTVWPEKKKWSFSLTVAFHCGTKWFTKRRMKNGFPESLDKKSGVQERLWAMFLCQEQAERDRRWNTGGKIPIAESDRWYMVVWKWEEEKWWSDEEKKM